MNRPSFVATTAFATTALVLAACSGGDDDAASTTVPSAATEAVATTAPPATAAPTTEAPAATAAPATEAPTTTAPPATTAAPETTAAPATTAPPAATAPPVVDGRWPAPEGDYSVAFPSDPELVVTPFAQAGLQGELDLWVVEDASAGFLANRIDYASLGVDDPSQLSLEGARDGAIANVGGTLVNSQFVTVQGREGIRFDYTLPGGIGESLVVADGLLLYQAQGVGTEERRGDLAAFAESLVFTEER